MQTSTSKQVRETVRQAYGEMTTGRRGISASIGAVKAPPPDAVAPACCDSMRLEACWEPAAKSVCCGGASNAAQTGH